MIEVLIRTAAVLTGSATAIFVILIALDVGLYVKLRSSIPQGPHQEPII
ncbi:hypothetical protein [Mycobacterium sp. E802]|nr:hypothetical protein [Mycobacterium sp. E802]